MNRTTILMCLMIAAVAIVATGCGQCPICSRKVEPMTCAMHIEKSGPDQVMVGQAFSYTIKATNTSNDPAIGVLVTEELPDNFALASTSPEAEVSGRQLLWRFDSLPGHASRDLIVTGTATETAKLSSCTSVTCTPPTACLTVAAVKPELAITLSGPPEALACDALKYTINVTNVGSGAASNVLVRQDLPQDMTTLDGKSAVVSDFGSLAPNQAKEVTILTRVAHRGQFSTSAIATADGGLQVASQPVSTLVRKPELVVTDSAPAMRYLGRPVQYSITVRNAGDGDARNTVLEERLMSNPIFLEASDGGAFNKEMISWNLGDLKPGEEKTVSATITSEERGDIHMKALATAYCGEGNATALTAIKGVPGILLEMIDLKDPIVLGSEEIYRVTVTNQGTTENTNLGIRCELPPEEQYVKSAGPTAGEAKDNVVTFAPVPRLDPGNKVVYEITVKGMKTGDVRFKVSLTGDQLETPVIKTESTHIYD